MPRNYSDTVGKGHGREIRRCWVTSDPAYLTHGDPDRDGCDPAGQVRVESERRAAAATGSRPAPATSLPNLPPKAAPLLQAVCRHWASKTPTTGAWT